jgi:hypothetical protein
VAEKVGEMAMGRHKGSKLREADCNQGMEFDQGWTMKLVLEAIEEDCTDTLMAIKGSNMDYVLLLPFPRCEINFAFDD